MAEHNIILKNAAGYDISTDLVNGLAAAKTRAKYFLTDAYAQNIGTTHATLGTYKVEVQEIRTSARLWDAFKRGG
jgi:hypothetical protein